MRSKKPTAKKRGYYFLKKSSFLIASLAPIPSVCSSSSPSADNQLNVPPYFLGDNVFILNSSILSLP